MEPNASALRRRYPNGVLLEDFVSLADSLEARLSRAYWERRGLKSFLAREVPNEITNDGLRASRAAEVLLAHCREAQAATTLPDRIVVAEFGIGLGLFARLLLRRFEELCSDDGHDFYERLSYYATDISERNLEEIERFGTLAEFGEHVRLGKLDALDPAAFMPLGARQPESVAGSLQAIFHNYVYDTLPQCQLLRQDESWYELRVQTRLHEPWRLQDFHTEPVEEILDSVRRGADEAVASLLPVYEWIAVERCFFPVEVRSIPHSDVVLRFCDEVLQPSLDAKARAGESLRMWVPWGAMESCRKSMTLLHEGGFMLFSDYGVNEATEFLQARDYQRYGAGVCICLNLPMLDYHLATADALHATLTIPDGDEDLPLHSRLLTTGESPKTRGTFAAEYSAERYRAVSRPVARARSAVDRGDYATALASYAQAMDSCGQNWPVLGEWAHVANSAGEPVRTVLDITERALDVNPTCSADLWNEHGDALLRANRYAEAERAYRTAIAIEPEHSRSHFNLARTFAEQDQLDRALRAIGDSLAFDHAGRHTDMLLHKQAELLAAKRRSFDTTQRLAATRNV
jgi:tetratricopeptide (TPR) repeat protein